MKVKTSIHRSGELIQKKASDSTASLRRMGRALMTILKALEPLTPDQRERVLAAARIWHASETII